jgi:phosphatidylglycerol:prolipoprotein diacylglycerol transferase
MRQTLFYIPYELRGVPVFGFGWLLAAWILLGAGILLWLVRRGEAAEARQLIPFLLIVALAISFLLPMMVMEPLGLPIRGYGVMLLLAIVCGVSLAAYRGRQIGIDPDRIYTLALWMLVAGIVGARLFYVIQYWPSISTAGAVGTLRAILRVDEGGLVVYGSLVGAVLAFWAFVVHRRLPAWQLADAIAPSLVLGLAIGRIGCLLNGCCFGGTCENGPFCITFPQYSAPEVHTLSPVYHRQLSEQLTREYVHGIRLAESGSVLTVAAVN